MTTKTIKTVGLIGFSLLALQGCNSDNVEPKNTLCEVKTIDAKEIQSKCSKGERILFAPSSWGNEQTPVTFASLYCDPRYSIALTNGGVSCVYSPFNLEDLMLREKLNEEKNKSNQSQNKE